MSEKELRIPEGIDIEYKIVVMTDQNIVDRWESVHFNRTFTSSINKEAILLRMCEGVPYVEEYYDASLESLYENTVKNYSRILNPLKIRPFRILKPLGEEECCLKIKEITATTSEYVYRSLADGCEAS